MFYCMDYWIVCVFISSVLIYAITTDMNFLRNYFSPQFINECNEYPKTQLLCKAFGYLNNSLKLKDNSKWH